MVADVRGVGGAAGWRQRLSGWLDSPLVSFAIIGTIWMWIYNPNFGALNQFLRGVGLSNLAMPWLGDERYMTGALVAAIAVAALAWLALRWYRKRKRTLP